jgi:hypothetical protein
MTDKEVDIFLNNLKNEKHEFSYYEATLNTENYSAESFSKKVHTSIDYEYLKNEIKLIRISKLESDKDYIIYSLTKKGRKVLRIGGWIKYLKRKDAIEAKKEKKQDAEIKINEFQAKNGMLPYYVTFGAFIISILSFINSCNSENKKLKHTQKKKTHKTELATLPNTNLVNLDTILPKK